MLTELTDTERATFIKLFAKVLHRAPAVAAADPIPLEDRRNRP